MIDESQGLAAANSILRERVAELEESWRVQVAEINREAAAATRMKERLGHYEDRVKELEADNAALAAHVGEMAAALAEAKTWMAWSGADWQLEAYQRAETACDAALAPDAAQRALARLRSAEGLAAVAEAFNFCKRWIQFPPGTDAARRSELYGRAEAALAAWESFSVTGK
jgi:DNA repair exonuclease SbcCD ATPase subunit